LADWHEFCRLKGLSYDRVLDATNTTLRDVLTEIAAAGRATPRHDGMRWGVTIDRPSGLIVDHITPRNSAGFRARRTYIDPPHAFRVRFFDAANDYREAERLIPWPGHEGDIDETEVLELPGKTHAPEVWREARRRQYEAIHRPDTYEVTQDGGVRVATRGDHVMLACDVIDRVQRSARVRAVAGRMIEIDEMVEMEAGESYGLRFRVGIDAGDTIGASVVCPVRTVPGETRVLTLEGDDMPAIGDLVMFGRASVEAFPLIVTGIEAGQDFSATLRLVASAPILDELLDADPVPAWSSRVGAELDVGLLAPAAPRFTRIASGRAGTVAAGRVDYLIVPGPGAISAARYEIGHRLAGAPAWTAISIPAANGGGAITAYAPGDAIELRARALSHAAVPGPHTPVVTLTVGSGDAPIPAALDDDAITVTALLGGALIQVAVPDDPAIAQIQIYRSTSGTLDRATDAAGPPVVVAQGQSYSVALGDTTRSNLLADPGMGAPGAWTTGTGWTIAGGAASHAPGTAGELSQGQTLKPARWYRIAGRVSGRSAGTLTPVLRGGTDRPGIAVASNGGFRDRLQAVSGNDRIAFAATSTFDGALDDAVLYLQTAACLAQGNHSLWVEARSADGAPGPVSGPYLIEVI
jgi:hypothetical protein